MYGNLCRMADQIAIQLMHGYPDAALRLWRSFHEQAKSKEDLESVFHFLSEQLAWLKQEYKEAPDLNWYMNRMVENFRGSNKEEKSVKEIKEILKSLIS
jgi:hypothetical protein